MSTAAYPDDAGLVRVLTALEITADKLLGHGGEAWVYALDEDRVVRVLHDGADPASVVRRQELVDELAAGAAPFLLPELLELGQVDGRHYAVERRRPGRSVMDLLAVVDGTDRDLLIERHLDAAAVIAQLHLDPRPWFGDLIADDPVRTDTWPAFLRERVAKSLRLSTPELHAIDAAPLAADLPDIADGAFVHLDAFSGNMLAVGTTVTAVLDFSATSVVGDARLDPLSAAVYLAAPEITPVATSRDVDVAMAWLRSAGLAEWFEPARRWLAAYWSFAVTDVKLHAWCRSVLLGPS